MKSCNMVYKFHACVPLLEATVPSTPPGCKYDASRVEQGGHLGEGRRAHHKDVRCGEVAPRHKGVQRGVRGGLSVHVQLNAALAVSAGHGAAGVFALPLVDTARPVRNTNSNKKQTTTVASSMHVVTPSPPDHRRHMGSPQG